MDRIQKILASRGLCSRRTAEQWIQGGRVSCNGKVCVLGDCADLEKDVILVDGKPLPSAADHVYIMLHKPKGFVTTLSDEKGRRNVSELVSDVGVRVYPIGRLDMDSEGLLLLTNDGDFANKLMHPSHMIDKKYWVTVKGYTEDGERRLLQPITLDGYRIKQPAVRFLRNNSNGTTELEIVIHEGRNRQVRRMCAIAGMNVTRLVRVGEGMINLGDLARGKWRHLRPEELEQMK